MTFVQDAGEFAWHAAVCANKRKYRDKAAAKQVAKRVMQQLSENARPYLCPVCEQWHLKTVAKA